MYKVDNFIKKLLNIFNKFKIRFIKLILIHDDILKSTISKNISIMKLR